MNIKYFSLFFIFAIYFQSAMASENLKPHIDPRTGQKYYLESDLFKAGLGEIVMDAVSKGEFSVHRDLTYPILSVEHRVIQDVNDYAPRFNQIVQFHDIELERPAYHEVELEQPDHHVIELERPAYHEIELEQPDHHVIELERPAYHEIELEQPAYHEIELGQPDYMAGSVQEIELELRNASENFGISFNVIANPEDTDKTEALKKFSREIYGPNQIKTTMELYDSGFCPTKVVKSNGIMFYITDKIVKKDRYFQTVFYVESESGTYLPRFTYLSNSSGTWRSAPEITIKGNWDIEKANISPGRHYSKGKNIHYTQETVLADEILNAIFDAFNNAKSIETFEHYNKRVFEKKMTLSAMFSPKLMEKVINTFELESTIYADRGDLSFMQLQELQPGVMGQINVNSSRSIETVNEKLSHAKNLREFVPDFRVDPVMEFKTIHTLLSRKVGNCFDKDIQVRVFKGTLHDRDIHWYMNNDNSGRIWIEKIVFADAAANSYGTPSQVIDSGLLTNKPLEYKVQTAALKKGREKSDFNETYDDISPLIDQLLPVKRYREAFKIVRN